MENKKWDLFISHASEDKAEIVQPLVVELQKLGIKVWYDEFTLKLGDSLRRRIDEGLAGSRYGVVVLSHSFFSKEWPQMELDGLVSREVNGEKVILPIWHNINRDQVAKYSPILAGRLSISTSKGIPSICEEIIKVLQPNEQGTTIHNTQTLNREKDPFDIDILGEKKKLTHYCYLDVRFDIKSLNQLSVAELYRFMQKHIRFENNNDFVHVDPFIFSLSNKKSNIPEMIYESHDYAFNYTNVSNYEKLVIAQGRVQYSFIAYGDGYPFYFSSEIAQGTLMMLVPILEKVHHDVKANVDLDVTIKVKSSTNAVWLPSELPLPLKMQKWEHYVHREGVTIESVSLNDLEMESSERLFNRLLEVFVSEKQDSSMPFLQVDSERFSKKFRDITDKML